VVDVPQDFRQPESPTIRVFGREVVMAERRHDHHLPWLLWLQGGPGDRATRPIDLSPWLTQVLTRYRVLLLDQRGTGLSDPVTGQTVDRLGPPTEAAETLALYRADSIVRDAEVMRKLVTEGNEPWVVLGESYGGFCALAYLSIAPEGLAGVMISGGLPPLDSIPYNVYRRTYAHVIRQNKLYWQRHPDDQKVVRQIVEYLNQHEARLPSGDCLTPRRFQIAGLLLGKPGTRDRLHYLLEDAFIESSTGPVLSDAFLAALEQEISYRPYPLYAALHESIYCAGRASRWSAERIRAEFPEFDVSEAGDVYLTGEMVYPWLFDEDASLRPFRAVANLLAEWERWPDLYDRDKLSRNQVPVAAAVYADDMFVDWQLSMETAKAIRGLRVWLTNEYEHDGLWQDERVTAKLMALMDEASVD